MKDDVYQRAVIYYGSDIDGAKIVLGVFDKQRRLQWGTRVPTPRDSYDAFLDMVCNLVTEADQRFGIKGSVGIDIPGMPEIKDGALHAANVPAASGRPLRVDLSARFDRDVRPDNDANCFALSEAWGDEFTQYPLVMGLVLGTGIGDGLVLNGRSTTGRSYTTGEFGHIRLPVDVLTLMGFDFPPRRCGCGRLGCIESYLSGGGFAWLYQHYHHRPLDVREIIALRKQGDEYTLARVECHLDLLAVCLGSILTIVDPDLVVTGGGLPSFTVITTQLVNRLSRHPLPVARVPCTEQAQYGGAGGTRGIALLHLID